MLGVMSACPQCGTVAKPTDKFCNTCGTAVARPASAGAQPPPPAYGAAPAPPYGAPPQQQQQQQQQAGGAGAPARCQMGHDIAPGASYCAQGHPIALDAMQFAQDAYGAPPAMNAGGYGAAPPQQQYGAQGYGAPQPSAQPIGGAQPYGADPYGGGGGGYGQPQPPQGQPLNPAFNPQGGAPQGYGQPPQAYAPQQPYGAPQAPAQPAGGQPMFNQAAQPSSPPAATAPTALDPNANANVTKALRGFLVTYQTNPNGDFWALTGGRHVVGRAGSGETVDVPLADPTISSKHAAVVVDGTAGTITLEDTGSTNGTFVNDEHLGFNGRRDLRDGDRVRFGGFTTIVKVVGRA